MRSQLTVIIPTLNNVKGIRYLSRYFKNKDYNLVVVDNSRKNLGFAGGVNYGAKKTETKWLLILNDDIEFPTSPSLRGASVISELIKEAETKKLDALSPILRNQDGRVENYGYRVLPYGKVELFSTSSNNKFPPNRKDIDGLTAACLLIKASVFKKLKGFDESFFAYLEDVDFFLRFKKAGYKMGLSNLEVKHNHLTTTKTMGNFKARQDMVNWWRLYFKHKEKFVFDFKFVVERLRNISGYFKATFSTFFSI